MGIALDLQSIGRGFESYSRQRCVTTLGKLITPVCLCHQAVAYNLVPAKGRWCSAAGQVTAGLAESNGSLPPGGWLTVICGLTACTPGSAPGPTPNGIEYGKPLPLPFTNRWSLFNKIHTRTRVLKTQRHHYILAIVIDRLHFSAATRCVKFSSYPIHCCWCSVTSKFGWKDNFTEGQPRIRRASFLWRLLRFRCVQRDDSLSSNC